MTRNKGKLLIATSVPRVPASLMLIVGFIVLLVAAGCGGSTSANGGGNGQVAASVSGTIKVGTAPIAIAVDSTTNKIYVTDYGTNPSGTYGCSPTGADFESIDGATESTTSFDSYDSRSMNPVAVALNPANHTLYVLTIEYWAGIKGNSE